MMEGAKSSGRFGGETVFRGPKTLADRRSKRHGIFAFLVS